jgi:hypothetical protein
MRVAAFVLCALLSTWGIVAHAESPLGLASDGTCKMSFGCHDRKDAKYARWLDTIQELIKKEGYKCPDTIPAAHEVTGHKGEIYLVQCGKSGLRYRFEASDDGKSYTIRPTEANSVTEVFLD